MQPPAEPVIQSLLIGKSQTADRFNDKSFFDRGDLRFYAAGYVQTSSGPLLQKERSIRNLRSDGNEEEVSSVCANDDGWADLATSQIVNGIGSRMISFREQLIENIISGIVPGSE